MIVLDDMKDQIPLRGISRISGIPSFGYYYMPIERHIQRPDPPIRESDLGHCIGKSNIQVQENVGGTKKPRVQR